MPCSRRKGNLFIGTDPLHLPGVMPSRAGMVKRLFFLVALLLAIVIVPASAWLGGYQNGTQFVLNTGTTLTNYQIGLRLSNLSGTSTSSTFGGSNGGIGVLYTDHTTMANWSDIRFTDSSDNPLSYWVETGTQNATSAFAWVRLPSISSAGTTRVRFYYGCTTASSASDGISTFNGYFSDFDSLDNWTVVSGSWSVSNGILTVPWSGWVYLQFNKSAPTTSYNGEFKYNYLSGSQPIIEFEANNGMSNGAANMYYDQWFWNGG